MTALRKITLAEQAAEALSLRIVGGELAAGTRLTEELLTAEFGISRTPVREALRRLAADGLVAPAGRGWCVARPDTAELRELFECRARLEMLALETGIDRIPAEELKNLLRRLDFPPGDDAENRRVSLEVDTMLHEQIAAACPNRFIADLARAMARRTAPFRNARTLLRGESAADLNAERRELIAAILHRDRSAALPLLERHIRRGGESLHFAS